MNISVSYICFRLCEKYFCIKLEIIDSITPYQEIIELPYSINNVKGVIKYKTSVIPIIDLVKILKLSINEPAIMPSTKIIIAKYKDEIIGILADEVKGILDKNNFENNNLINIDFKDVKILELDKLLEP